ncbi:hypothetical protein SETIT_8G196700v2 [Setaria italica]|uniref:Knottin scorpion toxin-like domain-containing protein n=1 Tax=Setaria italica TaxID=4555 RepID=A0A368S9T1_SETIT|nr:hypothetical protein SETIT_8G196700v2 [Setaria italica]
MACKMIVAAAASVLVLSFLLPSGCDAGSQIGGPGCTFYPSRVSSCELCKPRCQEEGNVSGFCDGDKRCICIHCSSSHDKSQQSSSPSPLMPAPEARGAWP